jgi:hypothetical protein
MFRLVVSPSYCQEATEVHPPESEGDVDEARRACIVDAMEQAHTTTHELWSYYFSIGGDVDELEVDAYLHGFMPLPVMDRELLAFAMAEM